MKRLILMLILGLSMTTMVFAERMGVHTHMGARVYNLNEINVEAAKNAGVSWIRDECGWREVEPTKGAVKKIPNKVKDYLQKTEEAGINQLLILGYSNYVYYTDVQPKDKPILPTKDNIEYYNAFLDYVRFTVGELKDYVDAYEIWNEPNMQGFNYFLTDGEEYAKLYLDAAKIIKELDPTARIVCGCVTGIEDSDLAYGDAILKYIKSQGDINKLIDVFSIHIYTRDIDGYYAYGLTRWENKFDSYGFVGDVWMTENGNSSATGNATETQAATHIITRGVQWESYLKNSGRNGMNFHYELTNTGNDEKEYEHNFGLIDKTYKPKQGFYAMKHYNTVTSGKKFDSLTKVRTGISEYGYVGNYSDEYEKVSIVYDVNDNGKTTSIALSGDIVYIYDYLGNITQKIKKPGATKDIVMTSLPTTVLCRTYMSTIESLAFDEEESIITVSGETNVGDTVTIELLKNGIVQKSEKAVVKNNKFDCWISVVDSGNYTVRVAAPEYMDVGRTSGWPEKEINVMQKNEGIQFDAETFALYDDNTRQVSVKGAVSETCDNQYVVILAIPESMDVSDVDKNGVGYIRQILVENGRFEAEFTLPDYFNTKTAIYLGGTNIKNTHSDVLDVPESDFLYVESFEVEKGNVLSASATVNNFTENEKKATIIIAQYDESGRLITVTTEEKCVPRRTYKSITCSLTGEKLSPTTKKVQAFLWSDLTGVVSLFTPSELIVK